LLQKVQSVSENSEMKVQMRSVFLLFDGVLHFLVEERFDRKGKNNHKVGEVCGLL